MEIHRGADIPMEKMNKDIDLYFASGRYVDYLGRFASCFTSVIFIKLFYCGHGQKSGRGTFCDIML